LIVGAAAADAAAAADTDADADHSTGKATLVLRDLFVAETLLPGGAALKALGALWTGRASANISRRLPKFLTQWCVLEGDVYEPNSPEKALLVPVVGHQRFEQDTSSFAEAGHGTLNHFKCHIMIIPGR
jgi:hypothetical protein